MEGGENRCAISRAPLSVGDPRRKAEGQADRAGSRGAQTSPRDAGRECEKARIRGRAIRDPDQDEPLDALRAILTEDTPEDPDHKVRRQALVECCLSRVVVHDTRSEEDGAAGYAIELFGPLVPEKATRTGEAQRNTDRRNKDPRPAPHHGSVAAVPAVTVRLGDSKFAGVDRRHFGVARARHVDAPELLPT